jgi:ADP-ribose 1''-phosphate phosphatase
VIIYNPANVFDLIKDADEPYIVHSCNCQGVWGSGIAKEMKARYPRAFQAYNADCTRNTSQELLGTARTYYDNGVNVVALFTSDNYGHAKDSPAEIILNTSLAINHFLVNEIVYGSENIPLNVFSPRINAGLFEVPWQQSERVINKSKSLFPTVTWTVSTFGN